MRLINGLSGRLLFLTIIFVMLAEVLIFAPSLARYRLGYLQERVAASNIVATALLGRERTIGDETEMDLLESASVRSIAVRRGEARLPVLRGNWADPVDETFDLDAWTPLGSIREAFTVLFVNDPTRVIRVIGSPDAARAPSGDKIEITLRESQLREAMLAFGLRILILSLVISLVTATLVFLALNRWLVRPIRKLTTTMTRFREAPEAAVISSSITGSDEIAEARRELAMMQTELRTALKQKSRLAGLGTCAIFWRRLRS